MNGFIPAMGAEHVKPEKLVQIVNTIRADIPNRREVTEEVVQTSNRIKDVFNVDIATYDLAPLMNQHYIIEEKYDGYDYLAIGGRMFSRRLSQAVGNEGNPVEKTGHVPHIAQLLKTAYEMCGCDLQGELYVPYGISDDVTKILGCTEDEAHRRTAEIFEKYGYNKILHYRLIDIRRYKNADVTNEPYYVRRAILEAIDTVNKASATTTTITSTDTPANTQTQKTINVVHETTSAPAIALKSITAQVDQSANPTV